jgi:putative Mn2+ efflux pump MntP
MNRNTENWLKAIGMVFGFISATALFIWGLWMFFASYPKYFEYTIVIILLGIGLFGLIKFIKDHLDDKDKSDKYYREMYPSYYEDKKEKDK